MVRSLKWQRLMTESASRIQSLQHTCSTPGGWRVAHLCLVLRVAVGAEHHRDVVEYLVGIQWRLSPRTQPCAVRLPAELCAALRDWVSAEELIREICHTQTTIPSLSQAVGQVILQERRRDAKVVERWLVLTGDVGGAARVELGHLEAAGPQQQRERYRRARHLQATTTGQHPSHNRGTAVQNRLVIERLVEASLLDVQRTSGCSSR